MIDLLDLYKFKSKVYINSFFFLIRSSCFLILFAFVTLYFTMVRTVFKGITSAGVMPYF
jgi:uncharacterized membrane protein YhdT